MIIAVTGGKGFIGSRLIDHLKLEGHQVRTLTRFPENLETDFEGDLTDKNTDFSAFLDGAEVLIHCAGEIKDPLKMKSVHIDGTKNLIKAAKGRIQHWVQLSSVGAYGTFRNAGVNEAFEDRPKGMYEVTKAESDKLVTEAARAGHFTLSILRPTIVYGPLMRNQSLFGLIRAVKKGWFFFIGSRGSIANYVHIDNVVEALMLSAVNRPETAATYIISDDMPLERFIGLISTALSVPPPRLRIPEFIARAGALLLNLIGVNVLTQGRIDALTSRVHYRSDKITHKLRYQKKKSHEDGVQEMVEVWFTSSMN